MRRGFTLVEGMTLFVVIALLICLTAPALQSSQQRRRDAVTMNRLKMIGLAMHNYHDVFSSLPPGWTNHHALPQSGFRLGWQVSILPMMEEAPLFERIDFERPEKNLTSNVFEAQIEAYRSADDPTPQANPFRDDLPTSNFSGNFGAISTGRLQPGRLSDAWPGHQPTSTIERTNGIFWLNSRCKFRDIIDGTSWTLLVGERGIRSRAGTWAGVGSNHYEDDAVTDTSHANRPNVGWNSFSSSRPDGSVFVVFCDGAVRRIDRNIDSNETKEGGTWQRLGARDDGQVIEDF